MMFAGCFAYAGPMAGCVIYRHKKLPNLRSCPGYHKTSPCPGNEFRDGGRVASSARYEAPAPMASRSLALMLTLRGLDSSRIGMVTVNTPFS